MKPFRTPRTRSWMLEEAGIEYDFKQVDNFREVRKTCLAITAD